MIYNLTTTHSYDTSPFEHRVQNWGFPDHHSPSLPFLLSILKSINDWLAQDPANVVAIHCKAGRGRTGVVISSYLLYSQVFDNATASLDFFASTRSSSDEGVHVPSQVRYVHYMEGVLKNVNLWPQSHTNKKICIKMIEIGPIPYDCRQSILEILHPESPMRTLFPIGWDSSFPNRIERDLYRGTFHFFDLNFQFEGDALFRVGQESAGVLIQGSGLCKFAFHSNFMEGNYLLLSVKDLDGYNSGTLISDPRFSQTFSIGIHFTDGSQPPSVDRNTKEQFVVPPPVDRSTKPQCGLNNPSTY